MTSTDLALSDQITYAKAMAEASLLPEAYRKQPANVLVAMQAGEALGITPFQAIQGIDVIKGRMSLSAELMRALVLREGHVLRVDVLTEKGCRLLVARKERPEDVQQFEYIWEDAVRAGLASEPNYKKNPKAMLLARATTLACKAVFADVIAGFAGTEDEQEPKRVDTSRLMPKSPEPEPEAADVVDAEIVEDVPPGIAAGFLPERNDDGEVIVDADGVIVDNTELPF